MAWFLAAILVHVEHVKRRVRRKKHLRARSELHDLISAGEDLSQLAAMVKEQHYADLLDALNMRLRELLDETGDTMTICAAARAISEQLAAELEEIL